MAWPPSLPPLLQEGYSHSVQAAVIETEVAAGPSRRKRISSDNINIVRGSVYLENETAVQTWWAHWDGEANHGASWFDMPIVTQGVNVVHEVRINNPTLARMGRGWRLSLDIETRDRNTS